MCVRRWRPDDRCVSFHHYLQGSPGEPGVPGNDGLKGEKVGKLQIKSSPESKEKWSYDVLLQVQHVRQLAKMPFRLFTLRPILSQCVTLCSCLRCLSLLCFCTQMFFFLLAVIFQTHCWKWQTRKVCSWHAYLMGFVTCQKEWRCTQFSPPTIVTLLFSRAEK